jgi:hypothetical protein
LIRCVCGMQRTAHARSMAADQNWPQIGRRGKF